MMYEMKDDVNYVRKVDSFEHEVNRNDSDDDFGEGEVEDT